MIPIKFLNQSFYILTRTKSIEVAKGGQPKDVWDLGTYTLPVRCRLDINKTDRYVSKTGDYEKSTHILLTAYPLPATLDIKENRLQIDALEYRILGIDPVYGLFTTPDHYEIALLRIS